MAEPQQQQQQELPKIYTLAEIENVTSTNQFQDDLIHGIGKGFIDFEKGNFYNAPIQTLGAPPMAPFASSSSSSSEANTHQTYAAQTCIKSGYFRK